MPVLVYRDVVARPSEVASFSLPLTSDDEPLPTVINSRCKTSSDSAAAPSNRGYTVYFVVDETQTFYETPPV